MGSKYKKLGRVFKMRYRTERLLYVYTREDLKDGVTQVRYRTDLVYLWIFAVFIFIYVILCTRYYVDGDMKRIFNGVDSFGNTCGTSNRKQFNHPFSGIDHSNRSYTIYLPHQNNSTDFSLCVHSCALQGEMKLDELAYPYMDINALCYSVDMKCPKRRGVDLVYWNRCYPSGKRVKEVFCNKEIFKFHTLDVTHAILNMGFIIILGLTLALFGICMLFHFPKLFTIYSFASLSLACGIISVYCWMQFFLSDFKNMNFLKFYNCPACIDLILAITSGIVLLLALRDFKNNHDHMKKSLTLLKLCSKVVANVPAIILCPLLIIVLEIIVIGFVILTYFHMRSCYITVHYNIPLIFQEPLFVKNTTWFFYAMSYWILRFLLNCGFYFGSDLVCRWYFDPKMFKADLLSPAIGSLMVFHLGSAVKGTIIYCFVNKFLSSIFSPYYWRIKALQLDQKVPVGYLYDFYDQYLKYINPISYTSMAMFGFDLQISSQISFVTILNDFYIRHYHRMKSISKSILRFKYSTLVIVFSMLRHFGEKADAELCSKHLSVIAGLMIVYFIIGDLCDLVNQIYYSLFMCICIDFSCNVTWDENDFTRTNLIKVIKQNISISN